MDHEPADIARYEFPDREPARGVGVLRVASSLVVEPLRRDVRVVVYPLAVVMAIGIGLLAQALRPAPGTSTGVDAAAASPAPAVAVAATPPSVESTGDRPSDRGPAAPSPRTR